MNKAELIAELEAKCLRVVTTTEEADAVKNAVGVKSYIANVMEQDGDKVTGRNIGFYVFDEGDAGEEAYYRDNPKQKKVAADAVETYLTGLTPATYIRAEIVGTVDEENKKAIVNAYKDNGDGTCSEVKLIVFKNGSSPIEHREII